MDTSSFRSSIVMGADCGSRPVFEEPLLPAAMLPLLLNEAVCVVGAFSFPFFFLPLDPVTDVGSDVDWGDGDGGRAYSSVQRFAVRSCCARLRVYSVAIEGTNGSCGLGSVRSDDRESMTLKRDNAGDQFCLRMSIHMFPLSEIFIWYILVAKETLGAENG